MEGLLILLVIVLIAIIIFLLYRLSLQKSYYAYTSKRLDDVEVESTHKIQELEVSVSDLNKAAYTDITTKIGNRDFFIKRSLEVFAREQDKNFTLIGFEISNIGTVNRMFGPAESDRLVRFVAQRLKENSLTNSVYAIVQSNLFAILIPTHTEEEILGWVKKMTADIEGCSDMFKVELQFGIYVLHNKAEKISEMLSRMVLALRSNNSENKNNYMFFAEEMNRQYEENRKMCQEMEEALENKRFVMYLQPMVDLHTNTIYSAEALVRWEHSEKGVLSPYAFLPVFENTNLMLKLDYYMWEEACKTIRRWIDNKMPPFPLMLNISPIHLSSTSFLGILNGLIDQYKLQKDMFVLELPESALVTANADIFKIINVIAKDGYKISIDNFGETHSPINLFADMPLTMVKLSRKFLADNKDEKSETVLRFLVAMAKDLDLIVGAQAVETKAQMHLLTEIGCDVAQGYYFSKPVSLRDFDNLNKKIGRRGFYTNEYYPTFSDLDTEVDIMEKMMGKSSKIK